MNNTDNQQESLDAHNQQSYISHTLAYALQNYDLALVKKTLADGACPTTTLVREGSRYSSSGSGDIASALSYAWAKREEGLMACFQALYRAVKDKSQLHSPDFFHQLSLSDEGVKILQEIVDSGVELSKVIDEQGNNLLHLWFNPCRKNCYYYYHHQGSLAGLKLLLSQSVEVNAYNHEGKTPLHCLKELAGDKQAVDKVRAMVGAGANLLLTDAVGNSVLTHLVEVNLISSEVHRLLNKVSLAKAGLSELRAVVSRRRTSDKLVAAYVQRGALSEYKMLEYIFPQQANANFFTAQQFVKKMDAEMESWFKMTSLKDFLKEIFGVSSSAMTNLVLNFYKAHGQQIDFSFIKYGRILKEIFMKDENANPNYLMELLGLENVRKSMANLMGLENHWSEGISWEQIANFFSRFSHAQVKTLLLDLDKADSVKERYSSYYNLPNHTKTSNLEDLLKMFWKYPEELGAMMSNERFKELNTIQKLHDMISREATRLQHKPYNLNQEEKYKMLPRIHQKPLDGLTDYVLEVAQTNLDLVVWGQSMRNCIGGGDYAEKAKQGRSILLGIKHEDQLQYCVEIIEGRVNQFEGRGRSAPTQPVREAFLRTLTKHRLLKAEAA